MNSALNDPFLYHYIMTIPIACRSYSVMTTEIGLRIAPLAIEKIAKIEKNNLSNAVNVLCNSEKAKYTAR